MLPSGTEKSAQVVLKRRRLARTSSMVGWGIGPFTPVLYCASKRDRPSRSMNTVGSDRAVIGLRSVIEKRMPFEPISQMP
jgi:hypothetical protein